MANSEAVKALTKSVEEWKAFRQVNEGIIDFRVADLKGISIPNRDLSKCDFSGTDLENANLDGSIILNSIFNDGFLEGISLVNCQIENSSFRNANLKHSTFRNSTFRNNTFHSANFTLSTIESCEFEKCYFQEIQSSEVKFVEVNLIECNLKNLSFDNSKLYDLRCKNLIVDNCSIANSLIKNLEILSSSINKLSLKNGIKECCNFSSSTISNVSLEEYDLPNSIFFDVAISRCTWPKQEGETTFWGKYILSPYLIGQPVQDIKGIAQVLRRNIADAQFLKETLSKDSFSLKVAYRIWGITTAYGQSLLRLALFSFFLIVLLTIFYSLSDGIKFNLIENFKSGWAAFRLTTSTFLGREISEQNQFKEIILITIRFFGFIITGLLLGVAANKIGKLSSE